MSTRANIWGRRLCIFGAILALLTGNPLTMMFLLLWFLGAIYRIPVNNGT